jgi:hypothetical protein
MEYEIEEIEDGSVVLTRSDGAALDFKVFDLIFQLFRQNPRFAKHWLELAEDYVFIGPDVGEA